MANLFVAMADGGRFRSHLSRALEVTQNNLLNLHHYRLRASGHVLTAQSFDDGRVSRRSIGPDRGPAGLSSPRHRTDRNSPSQA